MKEFWLSVDMGTTNTRISVWSKAEDPIVQKKFSMGVGLTAVKGENRELLSRLKNALEQVLDEQGLFWEQIGFLAASGMISSGLGIIEIPHIPAPVGTEELAENSVVYKVPAVCPCPVLFIPGVCCGMKNSHDSQVEFPDIMRGEETETVGILQKYHIGEAAVILLPGSHDKAIFIDERQKIVHSGTSITGELLKALITDTILAESVEHRFPDRGELNEEWLLKGCQTASQRGTGAACFMTRVLHTNGVIDSIQARNFLLGIVLENDLKMVVTHPLWKTGRINKVIITGDYAVGKALECIFVNKCPNIKVCRIEAGKLPFADVGIRKIVESQPIKKKLLTNCQFMV